jgi:hypothetical protein
MLLATIKSIALSSALSSLARWSALFSSRNCSRSSLSVIRFFRIGVFLERLNALCRQTSPAA